MRAAQTAVYRLRGINIKLVHSADQASRQDDQRSDSRAKRPRLIRAGQIQIRTKGIEFLDADQPRAAQICARSIAGR
jgi:hypothetical protein